MNARDLIHNIQTQLPGKIPAYDFHMHTTWTDGKNSAVEMYDAAEKFGLEAILFSEHARKTSGDWFPKFCSEIRSLNGRGNCKAFVGVEVKIDDFEGNLDTTDEILDQVDLVMASVHRFPGETGPILKKESSEKFAKDEAVKIEFELSKLILKHPRVDILGHPFGMSYRRFHAQPSREMIEELIEFAAKSQVAFEINPQYHSDPWLLVNLCLKHGTKISLGSNAHNTSEVGRINLALRESKK